MSKGECKAMSVELTTELEVIKHKLAEWLMQKGYIPEFTYIVKKKTKNLKLYFI